MVIGSVLRLARALDNYGNPLSLLVQRALKRPILTVMDRRTGVRCLSKNKAHRMFGETFHNLDYDYRQIPIRPNDVILDIGANHGFYSTFAAHQGAFVYAFEPARDHFELLLKNIGINGLERRIVAKPWAIGSLNGELELVCTDMLGGGMNTTSPAFAENMSINVTERYRVPCVTFEKLASDFALQTVRVLKLDCEGAELDILRSIPSGWHDRIDLIAMEHHVAAYPLDELLELLLSWGTHQISLGQNSILFAASNRALRASITAHV